MSWSSSNCVSFALATSSGLQQHPTRSDGAHLSSFFLRASKTSDLRRGSRYPHGSGRTKSATALEAPTRLQHDQQWPITTTIRSRSRNRVGEFQEFCPDWGLSVLCRTQRPVAQRQRQKQGAETGQRQRTARRTAETKASRTNQPKNEGIPRVAVEVTAPGYYFCSRQATQ